VISGILVVLNLYYKFRNHNLIKHLMNRLIRKSYQNIQKKSSVVLREFYEETIYFLHQPSSIFFRYAVCTCMMYYLAVVLSNYQRYYSDTYKRKRMRLLEIEDASIPQMSREEHRLLNESAKYNYNR
jgi:hypothetical protein